MSSVIYKECRLDMSASIPRPPPDSKQGKSEGKKWKHNKGATLANMGINIHKRADRADTPDYQVLKWRNREILCFQLIIRHA